MTPDHIFPGLPKTAGKSELLTQVGAICWRRAGGHREVLLVTSRDTGRWVIPKGWPVPGLALWEAARVEAWEEAGARGHISAMIIGSYAYTKPADHRHTQERHCYVLLYGMETIELAPEWPERRHRTRLWLRASEAATRVAEPELALYLSRF